MENTTTETKKLTTKTTRYQLQVAFTSDKHGNKIAYYWSHTYGISLGRWIRIGLAEANHAVATGEAVKVEYINLRKPATLAAV